MLESAYSAGVRHFDVAPIYGLGLAEAELGGFLRRRPDVQVATKFGLGLTSAGRVAGRVQGPVRAVLTHSTKTQHVAKTSGASPESGLVGRLLYRRPGFTPSEAKKSLDASRRALGRERVDFLLLHEPDLSSIHHETELGDFLEAEIKSGGIGAWGVAGELIGLSNSRLAGWAPIRQFPYDVLNGPPDAGTQPADAQSILFGFLSRALAVCVHTLRSDPTLADECSRLAGGDLRDPTRLAGVLLRDALAQNPQGLVLVSTTKERHLDALVEAAGTAQPPGEVLALRTLVDVARSAGGRDDH